LPFEFVGCFVMDDIRRKLELIDRQLTGPNFHERVISTCPLVFVAVGLIAGIMIQEKSGVSVYIWLILLAAPAVATVFFFVMPHFSSTGRYVTAYLALTCFICLGAIRLTSYSQPEPNDIRNLVADEPKLASIRGSVVTEPYISKYPDWEFARFKPSDPTSGFYLKVTEVESVAGWAEVTGTVRVQVGEPVLDLQPGDNIQAYCRLERFRPPTNPGQFDVAGGRQRALWWVTCPRSRPAAGCYRRCCWVTGGISIVTLTAPFAKPACCTLSAFPECILASSSGLSGGCAERQDS